MSPSDSAPAASTDGPGSEPQDFVRFSFLQLLPEWRRLDPVEREAGRAAFLRVIASVSPGLLVETYSLAGLKPDVDMLLWTIGERLELHQEFHARLMGTALGGYLRTGYSYVGLARRSEYLGEHAHGGEGSQVRRRPHGLPYLFVYPFVKKREWYGLSFDERRRIMGEHFRIGHRFPNVQIHTGYSFGLDDMEFILAFEAGAPAEFLELVRELRPSEASRYTALETPIFTCVRSTPQRMLELAEGLT